MPPPANKPEEPRRPVPNAPRPARSRAERPTLVQAPQLDMRRCRDIVAMLQLGEEVEDTDRKFLSDGCRAR